MIINVKRIGRIFTLAVIMLFALSISVFAADKVAKIDITEYETFVEALENAASGDTITLLDNIDLGTTATYLDGTNDFAINIAGKAITLELNGFVLKSTVGYATLRVNEDAKLTVQDSSTEKTGAIINNANAGEAIRNYGKVTIESGKIGTEKTIEIYSLIIENNAEAVINGGTFNGTIYTNGLRVDDCKLTINNGTFTGMLYLAGAGTYIIEDGNFTIENTYDTSVIELERGNLTITGGTFEFDIDTSANSTETTLNGNGSGNYKGTIVISRVLDTSSSQAEETKLTVTGGTFSNALGDALVTVNKSVEKATLTVNVSDATITGNVTDYGIERGNDETTIEASTIIELNAVAQIGTSKFNTLVEAIEYAEDGDTITLLDNIDLGTIATYLDGTNDYAINIAGKAITLELNGFVLKSTVGYATLRVNEDAKLTVQDSSTEKTGAIINNTNAGEAIRNYGKVIIESGKIGTEKTIEVYSLIIENNAEAEINGGTFNGTIYTNGIRVNDCKLTINNGTFTGMLYLAGAGTYKIENGNFTIENSYDTSVIELERGALTINGGTFDFRIDSAENNSSSNNGNASGGHKGVIVISKGKTAVGGDVSMIVNGGIFTNVSGDAFIMANESLDLSSTLEITDATVSGDIAYYGIKSSDSDEPVLTKNNIILKGSTALNNSITVYPNKESKEEVEKENVKSLQTKIVTLTFVLDNGGENIVVSGDYGAEIESPANPTKNGYDFVAWNPEVPTTFPSKDMTITATWKEKVEDNIGNNSGDTGDNGGNTGNNGSNTGNSGSSSSGGIVVSKYRITVGQKDGGIISPKTLKVEKYEDQKFEIKAKEGYRIKDVIVDGKSVGAVEEYTFENVKKTHTITAEFEKIEEENTGDNEWKNPFVDVNEKDWFYDAVKFANQSGLCNGVSETEFAPNSNVTRGMIVTILYRLDGEPATNKSIPFADVDMSKYYANAISWAKQNNIVNGVDESNFAPEMQITREQLVTILYRYSVAKEKDVSVGENTNILSYDDFENVSEYAIPAFQWSCGEGIVSGRTESTLVPKGTATRAEVAMMLMRFCK